MQEIEVVEKFNKDEFETEINNLLYTGYKIMSTDCSFGYRAILITRSKE